MTARDEVLDNLPDTEEVRALRDRHLEYYAALADRAGDALRYRDAWTSLPPEGQAWHDLLDAEEPNVFAALAWSERRGDLAATRRIVAGVGAHWYDRRRSSRYRRWVELALTDDAEITPAAAGSVRFAAAHAIFDGGWDAGVRLYRRAAELYGTLGDQARECDVLMSLGWSYSAKPDPDYPSALDAYGRAADVARRLGDAVRLGSALIWCGYQQAWDDPTSAKAALADGLDLLRGADDARALSDHLPNVAATLRTLGEHRRAAEVSDEMLVVARQIGDERSLCNALQHSGTQRMTFGDVDGAERLLRESEELARRKGSLDLLCWAILGLSRCALAADDLEASRRLVDEAEEHLATAEERGLSEQGIAGEVLAVRADLARSVGANDDAGLLFEKMAASGSFYGHAQLGAGRRAHLAELLGDQDSAVRWYEAELAEIRRYYAGSPLGANDDLAQAAIARARGDRDAERRACARAVETARGASDRWLVPSLVHAGRSLERDGDLVAALRCFDEAIERGQHLFSASPRAMAHLGAARIAITRDDGGEAQRHVRELLRVWRCVLVPHVSMPTDPVTVCDIAEVVALANADDELRAIASARRAELRTGGDGSPTLLRRLGAALDAVDRELRVGARS